MKIINQFLFLFAVLAFNNLFSQSYIQTTTSSSTSTNNLFHNSELKLGNTTSQTDRTRCVLKFGDGSNVQLGEWMENDRLSFKASAFSFVGGSITLDQNKWICIGQNADGVNRLFLHNNGTHAYIDFKDNLHFRADKSWLSTLTLYGNNTVGIGFPTTYTAGDYRNQGYKLAVNGGILCEEVKVIEDVPDADFVFEKEYKLMPLEELEAYVNEHKHLPDIQSADEFKENGYKLGDMDTKLLQKVEELTLYVIELQKQNMALKAEVDSLKGN